MSNLIASNQAGFADAEGNGSVSPVVPEMPPRMIMDLRTDCNLKCPKCFVHGSRDEGKLKSFLNRDVDFGKAIKVLDEVAPHRPLMLPGLWSEPLLSGNFKDFVSAAKERGMSVSFNSNGLSLREPLAGFLVEVGVDSICFSVDAMTPDVLRKVRGIDRLDKIHRAVKMMLEFRRGLPRIGVSFTVQEANREQEEEFVSHWIKKVDFVRIGTLINNADSSTTAPDVVRKPCRSLYNTMAIHVDGNVSYCCLDGFAETSLGNVFTEGVRAIWNGEAFNQVRHWHETSQWDKVPFCANCDRWNSYDFEEEIRDGILIRRSPEYTYHNRIDRLGNWTSGMMGGLHRITALDDVADPSGAG